MEYEHWAVRAHTFTTMFKILPNLLCKLSKPFMKCVIMSHEFQSITSTLNSLCCAKKERQINWEVIKLNVWANQLKYIESCREKCRGGESDPATEEGGWEIVREGFAPKLTDEEAWFSQIDQFGHPRHTFHCNEGICLALWCRWLQVTNCAHKTPTPPPTHLYNTSAYNVFE